MPGAFPIDPPMCDCAYWRMAIADQVPIRTSVQPFGLEDANTALEALRRGQLQGAAVLDMAA